MTFEVLSLMQGEAVEQIIFEKINTPDLLQVKTKEELSQTIRSDGGFGSTNCNIQIGSPKWETLMNKLLPTHDANPIPTSSTDDEADAEYEKFPIQI